MLKIVLVLSYFYLTHSSPVADPDYRYRNILSAYTYSYPTYNFPTYQQPVYAGSPSGSAYSMNQYPGQVNQHSSYSSYPSYTESASSYPVDYQQQSSSWYPDTSYSSQSYQQYPAVTSSSYQYSAPPQPMYGSMLDGLTLSYPSSSSNYQSAPSSSDKPAEQGKYFGNYHTKCHDGTLLPFRARCNKVVECPLNEDEYDCDWYKRYTTIPEIANFTQFQNVMREEEIVLLEFFAPWCPACITFMPELVKLQENVDIPIYKVNTDENEQLKQMFDVTTYPRVLLFTEGNKFEPIKYEKSWGLKFEPLRNWLLNQLTYESN